MTSSQKPVVLEEVLDCLDEGAFTIDSDWRITHFNRAAEEITGWSRQQVCGRHCYEVMRANICNGGCGMHWAMGSDDPVRMRGVCFRNIDDGQVPVQLRVCLLHDIEGKVVGGLETFRVELEAIDHRHQAWVVVPTGD